MLPQFPVLPADWREELTRHHYAVIFCWAAWSPTDKMFSPVLARVVPSLKECAFFTADIDEETLIPFFAWADVMTTPHLLLWKNGTVIQRTIGYIGEEKLQERFKAWGVL